MTRRQHRRHRGVRAAAACRQPGRQRRGSHPQQACCARPEPALPVGRHRQRDPGHRQLAGLATVCASRQRAGTRPPAAADGDGRTADPGDADAAVAAARDGVAPAASVPVRRTCNSGRAGAEGCRVCGVCGTGGAGATGNHGASARCFAASCNGTGHLDACRVDAVGPARAGAAPRARVAAPAVAAPAVELAGTALLGEPPRLVPGRGPATAAPGPAATTAAGRWCAAGARRQTAPASR